jgi:hypothetical protein
LCPSFLCRNALKSAAWPTRAAIAHLPQLLDEKTRKEYAAKAKAALPEYHKVRERWPVNFQTLVAGMGF